ncbi:uncharacterized protein LOC120839708 [Ixodes scapularis]|uniref:uncharacterized protein LOC120839708 n=1 Tax=Ixodes scapularis TaxID=6945 RepID=UPI001AD70375|nr:uncharacterized protein LOC120839708 [Ixodes scapularis]
MPGIVWNELDARTMSFPCVKLIKKELAARELDTSGTKEDLIQRLAADIEARRESSPSLDQALAPAAGSLALDPITLQNLAVLLQQLPRPSTTVTTLPDLSVTLPHFDGSPKQNVKEWLEDFQRVQQLALWDDATTRLIAASKLKSTARNWNLAFGSQYDTWPAWRDALKETFITEWTLIHWQERVMDVAQGIGESLHQYAFAKLRIIQRCPRPVTLSDPQKIDTYSKACGTNISSQHWQPIGQQPSKPFLRHAQAWIGPPNTPRKAIRLLQPNPITNIIRLNRLDFNVLFTLRSALA